MRIITEALQTAYDQANLILADVPDLHAQGWMLAQLVNAWADEKEGIEPETAASITNALFDFILHPVPTLEDIQEGNTFPTANELKEKNPQILSVLEQLRAVFSSLDPLPQLRMPFIALVIGLLPEVGEFDSNVKEELEQAFYTILSDPSRKLDNL